MTYTKYLLKRHGQLLRAARLLYQTPHICPDCYLPRHQCKHTEEWAFLRRG